MKATEQSSPTLIKSLYVGDSGTGKTGSLFSLLEAGYTIRMLDYDAGVNTLVQLIKHRNPDLLSQLDYITLRDQFGPHPKLGLAPKGVPTAYTAGIKYMNKWDDGSTPSEWGDDTIFVLDSLTSFGLSAYWWAWSMNPSAKDGRQWYGTAQSSIRTFLDLVASASFNTNVLILSHLQLIEPENAPAFQQVTSIGKALGGDIPKVFNNLLLATKTGSGDSVKRVIQTVPTPLLDVKNIVPWLLDKKLPLETGLATVFSAIKTGQK